MRKTSRRGSRKLIAGNIHYVDVVTSRHVVSIGLSIQVSLGTLGTPGLTLAQRRYLSSCRTNGFPTPDNFESVSRLEIWCGRQRMELLNHSWIFLLPLYKGTLLAMRRHLDLIICSSWQEASGGRPDGAHVFHHRTDELLIQWDSVPDGEITYPVEKRTQNFQSLFSQLIGISRQSQPCIKVLSKIMGGIDPKFGSRWAKLFRGFGLRLLVLARASRCSSRRWQRSFILPDTILGGWAVPPCSWGTALPAGRGCVSRVVRVGNQFEVGGWCRHLVDIQTEKDGGNYFHPEPRHPTCHDEWMWLIGRTLWTSGHTGRKKCLWQGTRVN
jgi:hypothetical protein